VVGKKSVKSSSRHCVHSYALSYAYMVLVNPLISQPNHMFLAFLHIVSTSYLFPLVLHPRHVIYS
jgi:hypothetical protein